MPDLLDGLNANQRAAVTHPGGPLLVVAGAGTGKTRMLTRRFAWLVEQGTPAGQHPGADLLEPRPPPRCASASRSCSTPPTRSCTCSTFHAFCARLLRDEALEAGVDPFFPGHARPTGWRCCWTAIDELSLRHHEIRGNPAPLLAQLRRRGSTG